MLQLQSFRSVFVVLAVLPLSIIGVVLALLVFNRPLGFVAILGILSLIGMVAKNAVILVVQIETDRAEGKSVWDAAISAASSRLRPLTLTAFSTVLGLIPIAPTVFWGPMAFAIMGGLLIGTLLMLVFLPTLYVTVFGGKRDEAAPAKPAAPAAAMSPFRTGGRGDEARHQTDRGDRRVRRVVAGGVGAVQAQDSPWRPFVSITGAYEGKGDLDQGGDFSVWSTFVRAGVARDLGGGSGVGVTLNYDYTDYSFSNPVAFGGVAPWNVVQRYGVAVPLSFGLSDGWSVGFVPSVDWFRENGAKSGDSIVWGAIVSATKRFADGNRLGLGVGVYDRIEKTGVFPFLIVDWRLSDRWRLINPLAAGPTGPAGLELDYLLGGGWNDRRRRGVSLHALSPERERPGAERRRRGARACRCSCARPTRSAIRWRFTSTPASSSAGELRVDDSSGNRLRKVDFDPAPFFAATFTGRF